MLNERRIPVADRMKIGVHVPVWGRLPLLSIVLEQLQNVNTQLEGHELCTVVVGSPRDAQQLPAICEQWGAYYVEAPNQPFGGKVNTAVRKLLDLQCDGAVGVGSDDLVSLSVFRRWADLLMIGVDYIGILDLYFLDQATKQLVYWSGYRNRRAGEMIGVGRCVSAQLLDRLTWRPFEEDCARNLDASMTQKLQQQAYSMYSDTLRHMDAMIVDVKTTENLNRMPVCPPPSIESDRHLAPHQHQVLQPSLTPRQRRVLQPNRRRALQSSFVPHGDELRNARQVMVEHFGEDLIAKLWEIAP